MIDQILFWEGIAAQLAAAGVRSFHLIQALMQDTGTDDATIEATRVKYAALIDDVRRAAGG